MKIEDLLARRTDLSTFLVHLTRPIGTTTAKENLLSIFREGNVKAVSAFGPAAAKFQQAQVSLDSQKCVCFTETPLEHVSLLTEDIEGRRYRFSPHGIAITKKQGRLSGINPVWYTDITPGHEWLINSINRLVDAAVRAGNPAGSDIANLAPFIEQMGAGTSGGERYRKEFWWEREWRKVGDFLLPGKIIVLAPEGEHAELKAAIDQIQFRPQVIRYHDPAWSLEQIIARLAGFTGDEVGPM